MSQAALLVLMEQDLVEQSEVEQKVCPVILTLTEMDRLVEFHTGAVAVRLLCQITIIQVCEYFHLSFSLCMR
jgi:serine/threonine-protein phosphatase 4 regulatory subunit 1